MPAFSPATASALAQRVDVIFLGLLGLSGAILLLVIALLIGFSIRYRRGSPAPRGKMPKTISREFEIGWTSATLFLFVFLFWWAATIEIGAYAPPKDAIEVQVVAKQWMWKTLHTNGAREIDELHVPIGVPVRLAMRSQDVIHSFFVPAFRIKQDVVPGQLHETWFTATKLGVFQLLCAEYCGTDHSAMRGRIIVMQPAEYANWLAAQPQGDDLAKEGAVAFVDRGCSGCHATSSKVHAPNLAGLYGRPVQLSDGRTVMADEAYIRDSILQPKRDIAAGYEPIMPSFAGVLSEGELQSLTAYIRSLSTSKESRK